MTLSSASLLLSSRDGASTLAEAALSLRGDLSKSTWAGEWSLRAEDGARLVRSGGVPVPADLPALLDLSLKGGIGYADGRLSLTGVDLAGQLDGAGCSGLLRGGLAINLVPGREPVITLKALSLDNLDCQAEDGMSGLVGGKLVLNGQLVLGEENLGFDLSGQAAVAEALVGSWYGRLDKLPVSFSTQGSWASSNQQLTLAGANIDLAGLVTGRFSGSYTEQGTTLRAHIDVPQLQGDFQDRFHELIGELRPELTKVSLGGRLLLDGVAHQVGETWALDLSVIPADVSVAWGDDARIEGLTGRLPVQLSQPSSTPVESGKNSNLSWSRLKGGLLDSGPGRAELVASANHWHLQQPLELSAGGGRIRLTALKLDLQDLLPQLTASLELHDIELLQLSRQLEWPDMGGLLNANLEEIYVADDEIRTVGGAAIQVFGGDFSIRNMRVEAPFSRFPTYHADIDFSGVDLYQLTNTFEFGEMNGIADGYIHELRLFNGTPSALRAKLETRSKGERNISVKAIRNLNTLSQGGLSAALSQGLYQFIDFYRYSKIGLLCSLQNDLFHIEGTGRADSNQYIIYGGLLPPRIDVTVSSPTVSFKEMVRRLKRIERAER